LVVREDGVKLFDQLAILVGLDASSNLLTNLGRL
jgi:hypothetical protein